MEQELEQRSPNTDPIDDATPVIIGLSLRLPHIDNEDALWQFLVAGKKSRSQVDSARMISGGHEPIHANLLPDWDFFVPELFNLTAKDIAHIDPQQKLALYGVETCLEQTGLTRLALQQETTGVYAGVMTVDHLHSYARTGQESDSRLFLNNCEASVANRVSHCFDFTGESKSINAACASSLVAFKDACDSISRGQNDFAFVIGVNYIDSALRHQSFKKAGMLSRSGWCHTFSMQADGYLPLEGMVTLLVTSKAKALALNRPILAAVAGISCNHNGSTATMTAPSVTAQSNLIRATQKQCSILDVGYIEAHGTGTNLGDPVELEALSRHYPNCTIGSIKANLGHMEAGSGLLGIAKCLLILKNRHIPPHVLSAPANVLLPEMIHINTEMIAYNQSQIAVSSFGFGGTNAHAILQRVPDYRQVIPTVSFELPGLLSATKSDNLIKQESGYHLALNSIYTQEHSALTDLDAYVAALNAGFIIEESDVMRIITESMQLYQNQYTFKGLLQNNLTPKLISLFENGDSQPLLKEGVTNYSLLIHLLWARISVITKWQLSTVKHELLSRFCLPVTELIALLERQLLMPEELDLLFQGDLVFIEQFKSRLMEQINTNWGPMPFERKPYFKKVINKSATMVLHTLQTTVTCIENQELSQLKQVSWAEFSLNDLVHHNVRITVDYSSINPIRHLMETVRQITATCGIQVKQQRVIYLQLDAHYSAEEVQLVTQLVKAVNLEINPLHIKVINYQGGFYQYDLAALQFRHLPRKNLEYQGIYVLVGGAGGIGLKLAAYLQERFAAQIYVLGRKPYNELNPQVQAQLQQTKIKYHCCDLDNPESLFGYLKQIASEKKISGIFHLAVARQDDWWMKQTADSLATALKQAMQRNEWLIAHELSLYVKNLYVFTSIQAYYPNLGATLYSFEAALKGYLCAQQKNLPCFVSVLGVIEGIGLAATADYTQYSANNGLVSLSFDQLMELFELQIDSNTPFALLTGTTKQSNSSIKATHNKNKLLEDYVGLSLLLQLNQSMPLDGINMATWSASVQKQFKLLARELLQIWHKMDLIRLEDGFMFITKELKQLEMLKNSHEGELKEGDYAARLKLFTAVCTHYHDLLSGKLLPQQIIFPHGSTELVEGFYEHHTVADYANQILASKLRQYCLAAPKRIKILEVGAGAARRLASF